MRRIKLTRYEKETEDALIRGEYVPVGKEEFDKIVKAIEARRKEKVLNIRINAQDLENIKTKAKKLGVKYQTFIGEILHKVAVH
ncbi:MAG: CopG family antitoxin [Candidatus Omnitrophota bacterium]